MKLKITFNLFYFIILFEIISLKAQNRFLNSQPLGRTFTTENQGENYINLQNAIFCFQNLDYEMALQHVDNAISQDPYLSEAYIIRANIKSKIGMISEAEQDMIVANRLNPYVLNLFGYNGIDGKKDIIDVSVEQYFEQLNTKQSISIYKLNIDRIDTLKNKEVYDLLNDLIFLVENENWVQGIKLIDDINVDSMSNFQLQFLDIKAFILIEQNDFEKANVILDEIISIDEDYPLVWYKKAKIQRIKGNYIQAKKYYDKALELDENLINAYFERAIVNKKLGELENAIKDLDYIINKRDNNMVQAYINRGLIKKKSGNISGALSDLSISIDESPNNINLYISRGNLYYIIGDYWRALQDFNTAIELDVNSKESYYKRALCHLSLLDYNTACNDLNKSYELGNDKAREIMEYFCID